jgi:sarcosine oxidase, subunit gamma
MMQEHHPLVGRQLTSANAPATLRPAENAARFNLRIDPANLSAVSAILCTALPATVGGLVSSDGRLAACIGPDEWFLIAPLDQRDEIEAAFAGLYATTIHSLVDIGHREVGIVVEGPAAADVLQSCIAFEVGAMVVGEARRTIIDRVQIILLREAGDRFRVEVWHSFSDHVWHLLATICREYELGV